MARHATQVTRKTHRDTATRLEHDCIGSLEVPAKAYWGIHTARALENFQVSNIPDSTHPQLIKAYATIKRACVTANEELGLIPGVQAGAIRQACMEIEGGRWMNQFPVDVFQGGAGTSTNMNMNEVIANRALELAGHKKGDYEFIHPNDDVNKSQSTNDTYPAACKLALIDALGPLAQSTDRLARAFHRLADRHANDVTVGRTQLQDAVPMTYGQQFHAFASFLKSDIAQFERLVPRLAVLNLGATAIGTGICANVDFRASATRHLAKMTGLPITAAPDPVAAVTDMSVYVAVSSAVKNLAIHLKKAADDLRLLNSGPNSGFNDINVPARQAGSSIMPGKVNPVIPECVNQCVFSVFGMDTTVQWAASEGQLQLNAFDPVIIHSLLSGMELITRVMDVFREECVNGITVNVEVGRRYAETTPSIAASLNEAIGYDDAVEIAKEAEASGRTVREVAGEKTSLPAKTLDELLDPITLSRRLGQTCRERVDRSGRERGNSRGGRARR
ncbi:aspartate ammonia-lyase [Bifidobacterium sp. SMB2]|uniref:Aspartate ammonia-lyase n=1 Tax=Bifidobacterium saimiriisciurei TaxID=2661627 RepID=A0ABX0CD77_9BIFI|nr:MULTISPECIES: aspartate ammonia-lyase [Bifidobacterium]NEG96201.1 aspartate ammonia-lyase [Bifidobacterium sp. SMB2]NEH12214.1 aspartate ammonia-lyase [Bifidobacterium saimiriisciurei]